MSASPTSDLVARVAELERQVRELRTRVAQLEQGAPPRRENPDDRTVVREKVTYDWQS